MAYRYAVNGSILFPELPLLARPAAIAAAGFDAAEFWWPFDDPVPADRQVDAFVGAVEAAGLTLVGLNVFAGCMPAGDRGVVSWPGREREFRDSVRVALGIGERLGCRAFNALYGNRLPGVPEPAQRETALANLAWAAAAVAPAGGTILLEPLSGVPDYPLRTADDVIAVLDEVGADRVRFLCDVYHLATNGEDVPQVVARHGPRIGHVQIADAPGRGAPGTGGLDLPGIETALAAAGYDGYLALEYLPGGPGGDDFGWLPRPLRASHPG